MLIINIIIMNKKVWKDVENTLFLLYVSFILVKCQLSMIWYLTSYHLDWQIMSLILALYAIQKLSQKLR